MKTKGSIAKYTRWIILALILCASMILSSMHMHSGQKYPSIHAICPLGGLENLWSWAGGKGNLQKLFSGTMTLFFFTSFFALIFGRAFCGNICPFGTLQELFGKFSKRKIKVPEKADKILRYFKYLMLVFITLMAWMTATLWISPYDPYTAFAHIWSGKELFPENTIGFIILLFVLAGSVFIDRFFCKYLCPAGALYGIISKLSHLQIKRKECSLCGQCTKACPMAINVAKLDTVRSAECIACSQCITACPSKENDLQLKLFGKAVKPLAFIVMTVVLFFGSLFVFNQAGMLRLTIPGIASVKESGQYLKIADLRGSMSIEAGAAYAGMELSEFYKLMEIPLIVPRGTRLKDVSSYVPGWDFHVIKSSR